MRFSRYLSFSGIDWPNEITSVLFTTGCNLRCFYCSNYSAFSKKDTDFFDDTAFKFLTSSPLNHVVLCGGEPTLQSGIVNFVKELKQMKYFVKLDTNGMFPDVLNNIVSYVDYIAIDVKTSLERYNSLVGSKFPWNDLKNILSKISIPIEFRTTLAKSENITVEDVFSIKKMLDESNIKNWSYSIHTKIIKDGYAGEVYPWDKEDIENVERSIKDLRF